ncbi:cell division cycle protein 48 [Nitzschia inconspicua]|uniref:Peroxisomal ATPase PEX1 n=1 Tax=Nitzschia inconspicua TaxID=303405 RepID=A0A9K3Q3H8_9STRA|nr:cell division cycle protein 48 [Nitzschia inconspicua]
MTSNESPPPQRNIRRVRLRVRDNETADAASQPNNYNMFVRLSLDVAWELQSLILSSEHESALEEGGGDWVDSDSCWVVMDKQETTVSPSVDFLPLEITLRNDDDDSIHTICASFNGGIIHCEDKVGTIEIPRSLLPRNAMGSTIPNFVSVQAFSRIEYGTRVDMEPVSMEDWELLEIHSEAMESGELLNQISVVYPKQTLTFRVGRHGDKVNVIVRDVQTVSPGSELSIWPDVVSPNATMNTQRPNCVLLAQNTEVIISPKTRPAKKAASWTPPLRLIPSDDEWGTALSIFKRISEFEEMVVGPFSVLVSAEDWPFESEWARIKNAKTKSSEKVVRVICSTAVPLGHAVLDKGIQAEFKLHEYRDAVLMKPCQPKVVGPDCVKIERVRVHHSPRTSSTGWSIPDIALSTENTSMFQAFHLSAGEAKIMLPVGSLLSSKVLTPGIFDENASDHWVRVLPKVDDHALKWCLVAFDRTSLQQALTAGDNLGDLPIVLHTGFSSGIRGPQEYVGCPKWILPAVERMEKFSSTMVKLFGSTGSGKSHSATLLAAFASHHLHRPIMYLNCKRLQKCSPKMSGILAELDAMFKQTQFLERSIIVLDDLDCLSPNLLDDGESNSSAKMHSANPAAIDQSKVITDRILNLYETASARNDVSIVVTCTNLDSINPYLFRSLKVSLVSLKVPAPSPEDQTKLLQYFISRQLHSESFGGSAKDTALSQRLSGFLPRDLEKISLRVSRFSQSDQKSKSKQQMITEVLDNFTPLSQMQASNRKSNAKAFVWEDIGGLFDVKKKLDSVVRSPIMYRKIYEKAKIRLPRGILLYGPPGCGKSCIVPALAKACNYPIVKVRGPEIFDKYIGASEAKVRELFERATQMAPSILFLDELEALAPRRGSDSTGVTDRVVNQLLTFLDGVEDASSGTVYIIGATSRPDKVDPAVVRPGRLERHLYLGPPQKHEEWTDLLMHISKQWNFTTECSLALADGAFIASICDMPRLSPADVRAAFDTAHLHAVHRKLSETPASEIELVEIDVDDLLYGFRETRPSLNESEGRSLDAIYKPFRGKSGGYSQGESNGDVASPLRTTFR